MNNWFKNNGIHLAIIGIFIALCFAYFSPVIQGKSLYQNDVRQAQGGQKEIMDYRAKDGKAPLWTNSMFGGMPAYQIWAEYPSNVTSYIISFFKTIFPTPVDTVLLYLLGAYLLFCVLRIHPWLAAAGAIAFAFSSYNFQILEAGHSNKALAIAFFAPILAGIILTLRGKYLLGSLLTAFFLALEIRSNHIQMTYYLFLALLILIGIEIYHAVKAKTTTGLFKSFGYLAAAVIIAVGVNAGSLWTTYEYGQETTRGKSNLTAENASQPADGLDKEYAYGWSQGIMENITFLIPNAYGGASGGELDEKSHVAKLLVEKGIAPEQAAGAAREMPTYWGEKAFTSGPFYFGAIVFFLFVAGLFIVKSRIKWWILSAFVLTLFLSFGKNFPLISDLFFNYFPLYNKFRAVESILAVTGLLVPMLAILAVKEAVSGEQDSKTLMKGLKTALYITGGIILVVLIMPTLLLDFKTSNHDEYIQQWVQRVGDQGLATEIVNALVKDRISMARADAFRSLIFVLIGAGLLWALIQKKITAQLAFMLFAGTILVDMWTVDRRYLSNENFTDNQQIQEPFRARQVDELIKRDPTLGYRVFDLTTNPFLSVDASYFHHSLGGYHAAKLKRYQELLDKQFSASINEDVLDMLNTKYVITRSEDGQSERIQNRETAAGPAWFVPGIRWAKTDDEEMAGLNSFDPKKEAIIHEEFKSLIDAKKVGVPVNADIKLINYHPDHLTYEYSAANDVIAVFSEIWYDKGWNTYVDGEKIPHFRANYVLRAAQLPGGNHKVEFKFEPTSYYTGETISLICSILLIAGLAFAIFVEVRGKRNTELAPNT
ncbi:YfhO family protein [Paradesertivirga mongoliensis]|uniref:YfhO family protein n=1 Tax=Paradesertivirga mongoliensis TaxID=2100740 RepID=A0ABW4ZII0_9SPHI|nr:YfhO family protein [Pedobacter mongoliensis]